MFFLTGNPPKSSKYKKLIWARLGVSRPIYVNVDSPNLGLPYFNFLGGYQWKKHPVTIIINNLHTPKVALSVHSFVSHYIEFRPHLTHTNVHPSYVWALDEQTSYEHLKSFGGQCMFVTILLQRSFFSHRVFVTAVLPFDRFMLFSAFQYSKAPPRSLLNWNFQLSSIQYCTEQRRQQFIGSTNEVERSGCFVKSTDLLVETGDQHLICSAAFPAPLLLLLLLCRDSE